MPDTEAFLNELAVAVQKHAMYPPGHPALRTVSSRLATKLAEALGDTGVLHVGVAKNRLTVGGEEIGSGRALLDSLASRLHNHQIAALHFTSDAPAEELDELVGLLAVDVERRGRPLGLDADELPAWVHIRLEPVKYERLRLGDHEEAAADPALVEETEVSLEAEPPAPREVDEAAAALTGVELSPELLRLAREIDETSGDPARLTELVQEIPPEELKRLLDSQEAAFAALLIRRSAMELRPRAVVELVEAASSSQARPIAPWLVRLLAKLAHYAETDPEAVLTVSDSDAALRAIVREMVDNWQLEDPRPEAYQSSLGQMATATSQKPPRGERPYFADRLVMMGLELEMMGSMIAIALRDMRGGSLVELLELLEAAAPTSQVAEAMWKQVGTRDTLWRVLEADEPGLETVDRLLPRVGLGAAEPLLDALERSRRQKVREELGRRVVGLGPVVAGTVIARLEADRPDSAGRLLSILNDLEACPPGFSIARFFSDADADVRGEAYRLAVSQRRDLDVAIPAALGESDPRLLAIGLTAAEEEGCPPSVEPMVRQHVADRELPIQLRLRAVRALSGCRTESALHTLAKVATRRHWLLRRRLAPPSPLVLQALACIRKEYRHLPKARELLEKAASSDVEALRAAAEEDAGE